MKYVIDRFEGNYAVCEGPDKAMVDIPRSQLPAGAIEGSAINYDGTKYVLVDNTADRERIRAKMSALFKKK